MSASHALGFALLIVLWLVVLLTLLATALTVVGRTNVQLAGNIRHAAAAEAAADGGVAAATFHVADPTAAAWQADGKPHQLRIGDYVLTIRVLDENAKLNPNSADPALLAALITAAGGDMQHAATLAQSIAEWHELGRHDALLQRYREAGKAVAPTGEPFRSVTELGLVIGMSPDLLARITPHLSVFATGQLNIGSADEVVGNAVRSVTGGEYLEPLERPTIFNITSEARAPDGSRFARRAVVALGQDASRSSLQTLLWEALPAD